MLPVANAPAQLYIQQLGQQQGPYEYNTVSEMVRRRTLRKDTLAKIEPNGMWFPLGQVPGMFSNRDWIVAVAISWTIGWFGIDRFYLGYGFIGAVKLLVSVGGIILWFASFFSTFDTTMSGSPDPSGSLALAYISYAAAFVWHAADVIRITARKLPDADGRPLA